jgi:hypothetical protein
LIEEGFGGCFMEALFLTIFVAGIIFAIYTVVNDAIDKKVVSNSKRIKKLHEYNKSQSFESLEQSFISKRHFRYKKAFYNTQPKNLLKSYIQENIEFLMNMLARFYKTE